MTDQVWRRSTRSLNNGGDCVELAGLPGSVAVRDSKDPGGPVLVVSRAALRTAVGAFMPDGSAPAG